MKKVISNKNLKARSPLMSILVLYLCFDKWNAPEWVYGAVGLLFLIYIIIWIMDMFNTKEVDIFEEPKKESSFQESAFQERLKKQLKK